MTLRLSEYFLDPNNGRQPKEAAAFYAWGREIDEIIQTETGLELMDLPDQNFSEMFEDGMTAEEAAKEILENEGYGE